MSVPTYTLEMEPIDYRWLNGHRGSHRCFPCALRTAAGRWEGWIGYRGRYSRRFRKPSFDLWFDPRQSCEGRTGIHLNAAYRDPSLLRGRLAMAVFGELGLPVPDCNHVWLTANGQELGLYTAFEALDAGWLERHGMQGGSIYFAVGTQGNFGQLDPLTGRRKRYLAAGYEKCCPDDYDFTEIDQLIRSITWPDTEGFAATIEGVIDVDSVLRWLVGLIFTNHTDGLVQNYALLRPPAGRWQISPWDLDGTWGRVPDGGRIDPDEMAAGHGAENYLIARLLHSDRYHEQYLRLWADSLAGPLSLDRISFMLEEIYQQIRPAALADGQKRWSNATFLRERPAIRRFVQDRTAYIREQLLSARPATERWRSLLVQAERGQ